MEGVVALLDRYTCRNYLSIITGTEQSEGLVDHSSKAVVRLWFSVLCVSCAVHSLRRQCEIASSVRCTSNATRNKKIQ